MASGTLTNPSTATYIGTASTTDDLTQAIWTGLRFMGSLRITVWGFFFAILLLMFGTLAQDEETVVDVKREYFNAWIAKVPLDVIKPVTLWPTDEYPRFPNYFLFPGGHLIGIVLFFNLIAAKLTRFHMVGKGGKFVAGLAFCLVGLTITAVVILGAHAEDGLQGEPPFAYETLWQIVRGTVWLSTFAAFAWLVFSQSKLPLVRIAIGILLSALAIWSFAIAVFPETWRIPDPGLRIVWQMSKSLIAGGLLLTGLILLFGRRGGNVLIHLSIGLLMLGQFIFGDRQIEERIVLADGDKTNMSFRLDEVELAIIDSSDPEKDRVIAIDQDLLRQSYRTGKRIVRDELPFQIVVADYFENASLTSSKEATLPSKNIATVGAGLEIVAVPVLKSGGAKNDGNTPAAYIEIFDKAGSKSLGTFLVAVRINDASQAFSTTLKDLMDSVSDGEKSYQIALRLRRSYKDYLIKLDDVQRTDYTGSDMVRDYSSYVTFTDMKGDSKLTGRIWMNSPMRYSGETFYQSTFIPKEKVGRDTTGLQVVKNAGWLMPYIACAFAALGMLAHFGGTFARFASRFDRERKLFDSGKSSPGQSGPTNLWSAARRARAGVAGWLLPLIVVGLVGSLFTYAARKPSVKSNDFDWYAAGSVPVQHEGRIKPLDSVARNTLQALSGRTSTVVRAPEGSKEKDKKYSATAWFYGLIAGQNWVEDSKVFRIDAKEVLDVLGLDAKDSGGSIGTREKIFGPAMRHRYSWNQMQPKLDKFMEHARELVKKRELAPDSLKFDDQKFLQLYQKINIYLLLKFSYATSNLPAIPDNLQDEVARSQFGELLMQELSAIKELEEGKPAGMLPPMERPDSSKPSDDPANRWRALRPALFTAYAARAFGINVGKENSALMPLLDVVDSVRSGDAEKFNKSIATFQSKLDSIPTSLDAKPKAGFEAWYNHFGPFTGCIAFYFLASFLAFLSLIVLPQGLRRTAFWMMLVVFVVHVTAIIARIYITGRSPVINLYSSAVFIGCGAVLFGLVVELLFPLRIGLIVGSIIGGATLMVAYGLDTADTMPVLEAVLDTQFWLTTHVLCITAGYLATFVAGGFAIGAIGHRIIVGAQLNGPSANSESIDIQRILTRVTYGTLCFAIVFSLVGTVLGGLWADDSWGRFWGWDPKENGALMIVLWNAIVLHARWDKLVRERGFALLAIGGNIVTAWSWFGTNLLGIGLHSYGFSKEVQTVLTGFVASQIVLIAAGWFLTKNSSARPLKAEPAGSWE